MASTIASCISLRVCEAGDVFLDRISKAKMLEAIVTEIDLCKSLGEAELAAVFQAEKDKVEK